jgi:hypothetical protein
MATTTHTGTPEVSMKFTQVLEVRVWCAVRAYKNVWPLMFD